MSSARVVIKPESLVEPRLALADLQQFVEHEVALLDEQRFEEWLNLFADDGAYWVPANPGYDRRLFGGRYTHVLRRKGDGLEIVLKRVDLTNCDQSFPALTQPF